MPIDFSSFLEPFLLALFGICLLIQLVFYFLNFMRLVRYKHLPHEVSYPPVSIIICARNEDDNLSKHLPIILEQEYPDFEVVVVNDCSWDKSHDILEEFGKKYSHLKVSEIREVNGREHGKKFALTIGIKASKHETLLLTDADCMPSGPDWIVHMVNGFGAGKEIVLGYGKYAKASGILNMFIRFDAFFIAVQFLSSALGGKTYMGVGRNMSYKKSIFFQVKGFASHMHILSGDDDLFINEVATKDNVSVVIDKGAFTVSEPKKTWKSWFFQKRRHHTTARHYRSESKTPLILYPLSTYLFYFSAIAGLIMQVQVLILISGILLRTLVQIVILHLAARKLEENDLGWKAPFLEFIQLIFIMPLYFFSTFFVRSRRWT